MLDKDKIIRKYITDNLALSETDELKIEWYFNTIDEILKSRWFKDNFISGSIWRKTSGTPINDIDIICPIWWDKNNLKSFQFSDRSEINEIIALLKQHFWEKNVRPQSHSIWILVEWIEGGFSIDIVPAIQLDEKNKDWNYYLYEIPSNLLKRHHNERTKFYEEVKKGDKEIKWEKTDPRWYIYEANQTDLKNKNFRLWTLFLKSWKNTIKGKTKKSLKSFHIEEFIKEVIKQNESISLYDTLKTIENIDLDNSVIKNRADKSLEKNIDFYITENEFKECKTQIKLFIKNLIINLKEIERAKDEDGIIDLLDYILENKEKEHIRINYNQPAIIPSSPHLSILDKVSETIILSEDEKDFLKKNIL